MKKIISLLFISALFFVPASLRASDDEMDEVFKKMAEKISDIDKKLPNKTVAVYGFEMVDGKDNEFAKYATEKITHYIVEEGELTVIERSHIDQVLKEQSFSMSGAVDSGTAAQIGKLLSVDAVVFGTIRVKKGEIEFIARVVQSEKGVILASVNEKVRSAESGDGGDDASGDDSGSGVFTIKMDKQVYSRTESITITYTGLPGNQNDWITIVRAGTPDDTYGDWFYTYGQKSGTHTFSSLEPGDYEIRVYFNWPAGGYVVQKRIKIKVK